MQGGAGNETLVAGLGFNTIQAGSGDDALYGYPDATQWLQAQLAAAAAPYDVQLVSPTGAVLNSTTLQGAIQIALQQWLSSNNQVTAAQEAQLAGLLDEDFQQLNNGSNPDVQDAYNALIEVPSAQQTFEQENILAYLTPYVTQGNAAYDPTMLVGDLLANLLFTQLTQGLQNQYPINQSPDPLSTLAYLLRQEDLGVHDELFASLMNQQEVSPQQFAGNLNEQYLLQAFMDDQADFLNQQENAIFAAERPFLGKPFAQLTADQQAQLADLIGEWDIYNQAFVQVQADFLGSPGNLLEGYPGGGGNDSFYSLNGNDTLDGGAGDTNTLAFALDGTIALTPDSTNPQTAVDINVTSAQTASTFKGSTTISGLFAVGQLFLGETVTGPGLPPADGTTLSKITAIDALQRSITVSIAPDATSAAPVLLTFTGPPLVVGNVNGNTGHTSNMQNIGIQLGNGTDTVNIGSLDGTGTSNPSSLQGTGTITSSSTSVTGTGTAFLSEVVVGDLIGNAASGYYLVTAVSSNASLTLASAPATAFSASSFIIIPDTGFHLPNVLGLSVTCGSGTDVINARRWKALPPCSAAPAMTRSPSAPTPSPMAPRSRAALAPANWTSSALRPATR